MAKSRISGRFLIGRAGLSPEESMMNWHKMSEDVLRSYFEQTQAYIAKGLASGDDLMDCLLAYYQEAWKVPKQFKGNSAAMGFVPEFLIFETVKQHLEAKYGVNFSPLDRGRISGGQTETAYFVDGPEPKRLLVQGLKIGKNDHGFPPTDFQHDITYMVKKGIWRVKALVEVKGYFESASLKGDLEKLENAEKNYVLADDPVFAFVGFIRSPELSRPARRIIGSFVEKGNNLFISPGGVDPEIKNSPLRSLLDRL